MAADTHQIVTLFMFFFGVALCVWRWPQGDRWHVVLCVIAAALWCGVLLFEPRTRTIGFGFIVMNFLMIGLSRPFRRPFDLQR
jgi:drug/metabolite transporter (DMT)-like permease